MDVLLEDGGNHYFDKQARVACGKANEPLSQMIAGKELRLLG